MIMLHEFDLSNLALFLENVLLLLQVLLLVLFFFDFLVLFDFIPFSVYAIKKKKQPVNTHVWHSHVSAAC